MGEHLAWPNDFRTQEIHDEIKLEAVGAIVKKNLLRLLHYMSDKPISPSVSKQTRRFAPNTRGRGRGVRPTRPTSEHDQSIKQEGGDPGETSLNSTPISSKPIGHIRSDNTQEGRLPSVHDGQRTRGGAAKVCFSLCLLHLHLYLISALKDEI